MSIYILGVSIDDLKNTIDYVTTKDIKFYTVVNADTEFRSKYKVKGVPMTILVNGESEVEKVYFGELTNNQTEEIMNLLNAQEGSFK